MGLRECRKKHTHREYRTRLQWLEEQWNNPDRTDYYLMKVAWELRNVILSFGKDKNRPSLEDFKIPFEFKQKGGEPEPEEEIDEEEVKRRAAISKAAWFVRTGQFPESMKKDGGD